jgi:prevent-host-death family protein
MITVNMHEAKSRLSELVRAVERDGSIVTICRQGKPVVRLTPVNPEGVNHFRTDPRLKGRVLEDPTAGVPEEAWPEKHR